MGGLRIAAPLRKCGDPHKTHPPVERDGEHIARLHGMSGGRFTCTIETDVAFCDQFGRIAAGTDDPRVPEPFVDALTIQR